MSTITFITGANKGLGYETARRLIELGQTVIIGARDAGRGQAAADRLGARFVPIDVTDDESVTRAAADIEAHEGRIDTLINNAGIIGARVAASELTGDDARLVFDTNVISVVRVTTAFLPLLKRSDVPAVINVSSGMGSFALTHDPSRVESTIASPLYTASKSAVTMMTAQYAKAIPEVRFNAADPGYTATDLNRPQRPSDRRRGDRRDRRPRDRGRVGRNRPVRGPIRPGRLVAVPSTGQLGREQLREALHGRVGLGRAPGREHVEQQAAGHRDREPGIDPSGRRALPQGGEQGRQRADPVVDDAGQQRLGPFAALQRLPVDLEEQPFLGASAGSRRCDQNARPSSSSGSSGSTRHSANKARWRASTARITSTSRPSLEPKW